MCVCVCVCVCVGECEIAFGQPCSNATGLLLYLRVRLKFSVCEATLLMWFVQIRVVADGRKQKQSCATARLFVSHVFTWSRVELWLRCYPGSQRRLQQQHVRSRTKSRCASQNTLCTQSSAQSNKIARDFEDASTSRIVPTRARCLSSRCEHVVSSYNERKDVAGGGGVHVPSHITHLSDPHDERDSCDDAHARSTGRCALVGLT